MSIQRRIYVASEMMLIFMLSIVLFSACLLACGISVNYLNFCVPVILTLCYRVKCFEDDKKYIWIDLAICAGVFIFFIMLAGSVFDHTWDGASYHKTAVGLLKEGWNPFYTSANEYSTMAHSIEPVRNNPLLWAEAYPKATWYFAATVYYLTGYIECGKCYTLIFAFITFGICAEFFKHRNLHGCWIYILSVIASLNPIVLAQFQTYYLDGVIASVLTLFIIKFLELLEGSEKEKKEKYIAIFALMVWGCNLKYNIILYIATICAIYCICISVKQKKLNIRDTFVLMGEGIVSMFAIGFAPYITNVKRYGNIFYGVDSVLDEKEIQKAFGITGLNSTERFWVSVFGRTSHGQYTSLKEVLKVPFTFKKEEISYYHIPDVRIGGFGVMFSGLFLISSIVIICALINKIRKKQYSVSFGFVFLIWAVSLIEFSILPQTNQFRYIPHLYLCIVFALYCVLESQKEIITGMTASIFVLITVINLCPWMKVSWEQVKDSLNTRATLQYLGETCQSRDKEYQVSFHCDDFTGIFYNLKDYKMKYQYINILEVDKEECDKTFSNWLYYKEINH